MTMFERVRGTVPLALSVGVLVFVWVEVSLNFSFHWVTEGSLGNGLALPANLHLVAPAAFVSWAVFFAAGADWTAMLRVAAGSVIGAACALVLMVVAPRIAGLPDIYGIAATASVLAVLIVLGSAVGERYLAPAVFGGFASVVFWWITTGLDGWAPGGGGVGNSVHALASPTTAGAGAFGGVLSVPVFWVFVSVTISLLAGSVLGYASVRLATLLASLQPPKVEPAAAEA